MTIRRIALFLATALMAPLAVLAQAPAAHAAGQRTQTLDTGYFKASITVNWNSKRAFTMWGWVEDTKCDGRGVYFDLLRQLHRNDRGGYSAGASWYVSTADTNGCNNGRVRLAKRKYTDGENIPLLMVGIDSDNKDRTATIGYHKVYNNPYIAG